MKQREQVHDSFWRGILQRKAPRSRPPGYVDEALNVYFPGGIAVGRPGLRPFNGAEFAGTSDIVGHGWHVRPTGLRELLVATDGGVTLQRCVLGGDPITLSMAALPTAEQTRVAVDKVLFYSLSGGTNTTYIFDGVNPNLKWDGIALSSVGLVTPPAPATPVEAAGAIADGSRLYVQTLVSPYHESNPSVSPTTVVCSGDKKYTFPSPVQGVDYDDPQATKWRLWRTEAGGATFNFVDEADIGNTIEDNLKDSELGDPVEELVNEKPPFPFTCLVEHRNQMVAVMSDDLNLLRFSNTDPDYLAPEGWPESYVLPVAHADGDSIRALFSFHEWLVVFKENLSYALVGESYNEYRPVPILAGGSRQGIGTNRPGSVLQVENSLFFAARDGIYRLDRFASISGGVEAERISGAIDDLYAAAKFSLGSATSFDRKRRAFHFWGHG